MNNVELISELVKLNPDIKKNWSGFLEQRNSYTEPEHPHDYLFFSDYVAGIVGLDECKKLSELLELVFTEGDNRIKTQVTVTFLDKILDIAHFLESEDLNTGPKTKEQITRLSKHRIDGTLITNV